MCDAGFHAALSVNGEASDRPVVDGNGVADWPGYAAYDGQKFVFGRPAEDEWFVHPRRVSHTFWSRLAHEPSTIGPVRKPAGFSELAFHFFREYWSAATRETPPQKVVLAVPGGYLKDAATEEEKIGLVLGIAGELKLPLAGIADLACAALCDPRSSGFNPDLPVVVVDIHLEGADLTLLTTDEQLERKDFIHLPNSGYVQLLKHLTATMGNRFLRATTFDTLEDGRIEQTFFRQTKDFLLGGGAEHRFQINTASRNYEMLAKREQLAADSQAFVNTVAQALATFAHSSAHGAEPCTVALTDRSSRLPGLEAQLHALGFGRLLRLGRGAAARGAACIGGQHAGTATDLADVPIKTCLPLSLARRAAPAPWEARLQKLRHAARRPEPTHVILDGIGYALGSSGRFTIAPAGAGVDLVLPDSFSAAGDCTITLVREGGRVWFVDHGATRDGNSSASQTVRTAVESGDRLTVHCGPAAADLMFVHCLAGGGDIGSTRRG
jgi:hypothetical protein